MKTTTAPIEARDPEKPEAAPLQLPFPPLYANGGQAASEPEPVRIHFLNGKTESAALLTFQTGFVTCRFEAGGQGQLQFRDVAYSEIKYLEFPRRERMTRVATLLSKRSQGVVLPPARQEFEVECADGERLCGETFGFRLDRHGLHLFPVDQEKEYWRLFLPLSAVKTHRIGPQLGQVLVEQHLVAKEDVESGLKLQQAKREQPLGEYLTSLAVVTREQLEQALARQKSLPHLKLGEVLLRDGLVTKQQLDQALAAQAENRKTPLGEILVAMGVITEQSIKQTLAKKLGIPFVNLHQFKIEAQTLKHVPEELARKHQVMPIYAKDKQLIVAVDNPMRWEAAEALRFRTGLQVDMVMATPADIDWAIEHYYGQQQAVDAVDDLNLELLEPEDADRDVDLGAQQGQQAPVVRLVDSILLDAARQRASDIHIRPGSDGVKLLFRIHGELLPMRSLTKSLLPALVARIKIMAGMNIAERRRPQDGRIRMKMGNRVVDYRVSVMPTVSGESVVMRVQDRSQNIKRLQEIGFRDADLRDFVDVLHRNAGIILVTGATGSGKSSTLYAALQVQVERNVHVITVEDPVEAQLEGAEQIQVNNAAGYTFASALRNILRHDPDVIMIGEIRDQETAKIALESAMTGHLVLSTLHTNDAPSTLNRLIEMGIEPYVLGVSLLGVLSQRLVRLNCMECLEEEAPPQELRTRLSLGENVKFYRGKGCSACGGTGCSGRTLVYEFLRVTPGIRRLINEQRSAADISAQARSEGMLPIIDHALELAKAGRISLEQAYLVKQA